MPQRTSPAENRLAIIAGGTGDTGRRLASRLHRRDVDVWLTSREPSTDELHGSPVRRWRGAGAAEALGDLLQDAGEAGYEQIVIFNVIGAWLENPREGILGVVEALVEAAPGPLDSLRIVHCSATSVYGDRPGEELEEESTLSPALEVGRIHADAEAHLLAHAHDYQAVVLRVPHIYGPDRERTVDMMADGRFAVAGDGENPMNHIHVEDLVRAMEAAAFADVDGEIINIVDDEAPTYGAYCDFITDWYARPALPRVALDEALEDGTFAEFLGPAFRNEDVLREFYLYMTSHARISNEKMKAMLDIDLRYETAFDGLESLLSERDAD